MTKTNFEITFYNLDKNDFRIITATAWNLSDAEDIAFQWMQKNEQLDEIRPL